MTPDFKKETKEILVKRAANLCSNPDCRVLTTGPSKSPEKAINIGEAAHIYGARNTSSRYDSEMTNLARSEITNGIWLCKNCHKQIDDDPYRYSAELLFEWRNIHENHVINKLGTQSENLERHLNQEKNSIFTKDSALARQIIIDKPYGWEFSLTAQFLKDYLEPFQRKWSDLKCGLYVQDIQTINDENALSFLSMKMNQLSGIVGTLTPLYTEELATSWGIPGVPGDPREIKHVCKLIKNAGERLVSWEESVRFVYVSETFEDLFGCLPGPAGLQLEMLTSVPQFLEEGVEWSLDNPDVERTIHHEIIFKMPDRWEKRVHREIKRAEQKMLSE